MSLLFDIPGRHLAVEKLHAATALYTTAHVVDSLLDRLQWPQSGGRLLDPSAGDGSFLLQAIRRLDLSGSLNQVNRIRGWEIHSGAVESARARITEYLIELGWARVKASRAAERVIINKDFLTDGPPAGEFRIIAGNPPYLRFQRLPEYFKVIYGDCLPKYAQGDLLHAFLDWCTKILPDDGAIGLVCSDRFLFNSSAAELRAQLGGRVSIAHLARLDPATSFYRPKIRVKDSPPRIHPVEVVLHPGRTGFPLTRAAISPDEPGEEIAGRTLSDIAKVSIAPWLGPMGIFVVTGIDARLLQEASADLIPAVDTDDIDAATDTLTKPTRFAIRTSRAVQPVGLVDEHLQAQRGRMPKRGRNRPYWVPPEVISLDLSKPSLLVPRIARTLRAIPLPAGVLPLNHNLSVISTNLSLRELRDLLTCENSQAWIRRNAPRLDSGYYSITTRLLRRLPV